MKERFGDALRRIRGTTKMTIGQLARELDVSVTYLSDVERNERPPLNFERILIAARVLRADPMDLLEKAAMHHGEVTLPATRGTKSVEAGAALQRGWETFSEEDYDDIRKLAEGLLQKRKIGLQKRRVE